MLEVYFFPFSLPLRDRILHTLKLCEFGNAIINYLRLVLPQETSKVEYIRFIDLPK